MAGKSTYQRGMEKAPENGKKSSHSAHANGMNEQNFNRKSSREETHTVEIVGDGRKAFKSTERNVTAWTRFYCFSIWYNWCDFLKP